MSRQTQWFGMSGEAEAFAVGKRGAKVRFEDGGWVVAWGDDGADVELPDPFERIVSRNGGDGSVDAPAEIVQRLKVKTVGQYTAYDFHVDLCEVKKPHRMVSFRVTQADAARFTVGSEIEVVLRPAPLA